MSSMLDHYTYEKNQQNYWVMFFILVLISDEDDLMPLLMKEFPHLYISDHTWHELWRKGISQIEGLTRSYEENKRRKSKVQKQVGMW